MSAMRAIFLALFVYLIAGYLKKLAHRFQWNLVESKATGWETNVFDVNPAIFWKRNLKFVREGIFEHFHYPSNELLDLLEWKIKSGTWTPHLSITICILWRSWSRCRSQKSELCFNIKITNLEDFAGLGRGMRPLLFDSFAVRSFSWSRKFPEISDNGLEQGGTRQFNPVVSRKWAMIKDIETSWFTSETEKTLSQSILMLSAALKDSLKGHSYAVDIHTHDTTMLKLCCASQQIYGNKDVEELTVNSWLLQEHFLMFPVIL